MAKSQRTKDTAGTADPEYRQPETGDRRFNCQCGVLMPFGEQGSLEVLNHVLMGHSTFMERYSMGRWTYHHREAAEYIVEQLASRLPGENVEQFIQRVERMGDLADETRLTLAEARRKRSD